MAINDVLQATIVQSLQGSVIVNVLHYRVDAIGAGTAEIALAQQLGEDLAPAMKAALSSDWQYVSTIGQKIFPTPRTFPFIDTTDSGNGLVGVQALPGQNTMNLTKTTQFAGTRWRGRMCVSGWAQTAQADGLWTTTAITAAAPIVSVLTANVQTGAWVFKPVLFHRDNNSVTPIDDFIARETVRAQRRRQVGKGS